MSLKVRCPNGCLLRAPEKRIGKVIRCPKCKSSIRISESKTNGDKVFQSEFVDERFEVQIQTTDSESSPVDAGISNIPELDLSPIATQPSNQQMAGRIERARIDRVLIAKFIACFIIVVGMVNIAPAAYHWYLWAQDPIAIELPRWTYIQIFIAALHIIYAIFVLQIGDWSSLKAVSIAMLVFGAAYGFVSAGLLLGGSESPITTFLGLKFTMLNTATIWCVSMLLLAIITCYVAGKEAINWQRIDQIFDKLAHEAQGRKK